MTASTSLDRVSLIERLLRRMNLRFSTLFLLFAVLTVVDLLISDFIPFADEIGLALITLILGLWRDRRKVPGLGYDSSISAVGRRPVWLGGACRFLVLRRQSLDDITSL